MGVNVIKLREPASLTNGVEFITPNVPCRGAQSVTYIVRATDGNQLASIAHERSNEAGDAWQTSLAGIIVESGDALTAQTLNNSTAGTIAGRCRQYAGVAGAGIPFRYVRLRVTAGGTTIAGLEIWAIVVDNAGDPGISSPRN